MKSLVFLFFLAASQFGQDIQLAGPQMSLDKETHDYGTIAQNSDGNCTFEITNTGSEPLIIKNAVGSCQCTVPSWPKDPIQPGETATLKVRYNTNRVGPINKTVTITSNDVENPVKRIRIKGTVVKAEVSKE